MNRTFNKWDRTMNGTTCGLTSLEAQIVLLLLPVNTRVNTDQKGHNMDRNQANIERK